MTTTVFALAAVFCLNLSLRVNGNGCLSGFPSLSEVTSFSCPSSDGCFEGVNQGSPGGGRQLRLFPNMTITCIGMLQGLTVAGEDGRSLTSPYPEFQIWRCPSDSPNTYNRLSTLAFEFPVNCSSQPLNSRQCTIEPAIPVQVGDVIGIVLPRNHKNFAAFRMYFSSNVTTESYILSNVSNKMYITGTSPSEVIQQPLIYLSIQEGAGPPTTQPGAGPPTTQPGAGPPTTQPGTGPPTTQPGAGPPTTQPGTGPPTTQPGAGPPTTQPGAGPPTTQPGAGPHTTQPGAGPPTTQPGTGPPTTQPGAGPPTTQPGAGPPTTQPGAGPPATQPGAGPPATQPGAGPPATQPGAGPPTTQPLSQSESDTTPVTPLFPTTTSDGSTTEAAVARSAAAVPVSVLVILLILALIALCCIVLVVMWRRRRTLQTLMFDESSGNRFQLKDIRKGSMTSPLLEHDYNDVDASETKTELQYDYVVESQYSLITASEMYDTPRSPSNSVGQYSLITESQMCDPPPTTTDPDAVYEVVTINEDVYTSAVPTDDSAQYDWGMVVPSLELRNQARCTLKPNTSERSDSDCIYEVIRTNTYRPAGRSLSFFKESDTYWVPSSDTRVLYKQLSLKRYREILRQHIQVTDFIGAGEFGTVSKGLWQSQGEAIEVAIKTLKKGDEEKRVKFLQEAAIMGQFKHPNVVRLIGVVTVGEPMMIILELLSNGDLRDYLMKMRPEPGELVTTGTPKLLLKFCQHISCGMEYLARKAFVHRDLAVRNILVSQDMVCKIGDFGMSRNLDDDTYYVSKTGGKIPIKWTAPEALNYKKYSTASDVWSFGCVMYEIWSLGHKPFEGFTNQETLRKVDRGFRLPPPPGCSRQIYKLMIDCWHPEYSRRPSFAQLVEMLSQADFERLLWREEDTNVGPQASVVGGPLDASKNLYSDLQSAYITY